MATTYWVGSSAKGDESGSSYVNAIGTLPGAIALCAAKGDILNVIADGDHTWPTSETDIPATTIGSSFSDYGTLIRGVVDDASEDPALASVVASGGDAGRSFFRVVDTTGYVLVRNLEFDATGKTGDASIYFASRLRDTPAGSPYPGPVRFEGCSFLGAATGIEITGGARLAFAVHATGPGPGSPLFELEDCYFQNWELLASGGSTQDQSIVGCVIYNDVAAGGNNYFSNTLAAGAGGELIFTNNTLYESIGNNGFSSPVLYTVADGLGAGLVNVKDNLIFLNSTQIASPSARFFFDGGPGTGTFTGTIDYNVLLGGPDIVSGDVHVDGWYQDLWDTAVRANDQIAYEVAEATIFTTPGSTYAWDALDNGVTITILKDMRLLLYGDASSTGGVVGALPAGQTDYTVTLDTSTSAPDPGETVVLTAGIANSGTNATALVLSIPIPAGLTYVSDVAGQGTYVDGTGLWNVGALADAASATLAITVTVDADQAGETITATASIDSSAPVPGPPLTDDSDSAVLSVTDDSSPIDPDGEGGAPFVDTLPLQIPTLSLELNTRLGLEQSRGRTVYERQDFENTVWNEYTSKRIVLAPSTTMEVNLGGIQRAEFLVLDATTAVDVSAVRGDTPQYWIGIKKLVIGRGDFEKVHLRNTSLTLSSTIQLGATD